MTEKYKCSQCGAEVENPGTICDNCFRGNETFDQQFRQNQEDDRRREREQN
jgi:DNA-directed RNA polymerase subunit RPC12/RpoP